MDTIDVRVSKYDTEKIINEYFPIDVSKEIVKYIPTQLNNHNLSQTFLFPRGTTIISSENKEKLNTIRNFMVKKSINNGFIPFIVSDNYADMGLDDVNVEYSYFAIDDMLNHNFQELVLLGKAYKNKPHENKICIFLDNLPKDAYRCYNALRHLIIHSSCMGYCLFIFCENRKTVYYDMRKYIRTFITTNKKDLITIQHLTKNEYNLGIESINDNNYFIYQYEFPISCEIGYIKSHKYPSSYTAYIKLSDLIDSS